MEECRKGRKRVVPFDCKRGKSHSGPCSPFTVTLNGGK